MAGRDAKASIAARTAAKTHGLWLSGARESRRDLMRTRAARLESDGRATTLRWHQHEDLRAVVATSTDASDAELTRPPAVYLHGGAHVLGSPDDVAARLLALHGRRPVISVEHPLAPEHPYPAAIEALGHLPGLVDACLRLLPGHRGPESWDLVAHTSAATTALAWLLRTYTGSHLDHPPASDAPDAAHGSVHQVAEPWPLSRHPRRLVLLQPWTDPLQSGSSHHADLEDPGLQPAWLVEAAALLHADGHDLAHPELSVARAAYADVAEGAWPLTLMVAGAADPMLSDAVLLHRALRAAGHPSRLELWDGVGHDFVSDPELPASREAWHDVAAFLG